VSGKKRILSSGGRGEVIRSADGNKRNEFSKKKNQGGKREKFDRVFRGKNQADKVRPFRER